MQIACPNCNKNISLKDISCPYCGFNMKVFSSFLDVKNELDNHQSIAHKMRANLDQLDMKLKNAKDALDKNLIILKNSLKLEKVKPPIALVPETIIEKKLKQPDIPKTIKKVTNNIEKEVAFGQKWLLLSGIIILVMGIGYFLKYSFSQNWVSPTFRVLSVYLCGGSLLGAGEYFRRKLSAKFGLYLIGGGLATLYFATYAAFGLYHILGQIPSFALMVLITILCGILSLFYNTKWLAIVGILGGFLTPIILSTGEGSFMILMTYITILNLCILTISSYKQWALLNKLGLFFTWAIFSGWFFSHYVDSKFISVTVFLNIFFLIHQISPFIYYFKERDESIKGMWLIILNTFIALGFSFATIKPLFGLPYVSFATLFYALTLIILAHILINRNKKNKEPLIILVGQATFFIIITIPLIFSGHWITFFWCMQSIMILWIAIKTDNTELLKISFLLFAGSLFKFFLYDLTYVFKLHYLNYMDFTLKSLYFKKGFYFLLQERLITSLTVLGSTLIAFKFYQIYDSKPICKNDSIKNSIMACFGILLFIILNIEVSGFFHSNLLNAHFAGISVFWAIFSIVLICIGFIKNIYILRQCAIGLFAITLIKVFLIDMSKASAPFRILSFMVLGILLILSSFLYYKFKDKIISTKQETL